MNTNQRRLSVVAALLAFISGCGGGGGSASPAPAPAPVSQASATLSSPSDNRFPWNIEKAITVALKDPQGAVVSPVTCQSANASLIAVSSDCGKVTLGRLGAQSITVSGGGHSASVTLQGVPQRHWSGLHGVASTSSGPYSMVNLVDGTAASWGSNNFGVLGRNSNLDEVPGSSLMRLVLDASGMGALTQLYQASAGDTSVFALSENGSVWGWGQNFNCNLAQANCGNPELLPVRIRNAANGGALTNVVQVEAGATNQVALIDDGTVMTWGHNHGQGDETIRAFPGLVKTPDGSANLSSIVAVSAGNLFSLGLAKDGRVYAWGAGSTRGTGQTSGNPNPLPNTVKKQDGSELTGIVSISAGYNFSMALALDGTVWGWGAFGSPLGQNPLDIVSIPHAIQVKAPAGSSGLLSNIVMVVAGGQHALALDNTGKVFAWGVAASGQLGDGPNRTAGNALDQARAVVAEDGLNQLSGVASIAASYNGSSALKTDGTVLMWGDNFRGALGRGDTVNSSGLWVSSAVPAPVVANAAKDPLKLGSLAAYPNLLRRVR